jgi:glycosyltransferase involved in cell wall biosynthesis
MSKLTISVVICTYNGEKYISEQIDSIANQTRKADEIIIIDDNSVDNTFDILTQYEKYFKEINLFKNEDTLGYIKNFSKGMLKATKDIVVLSDQDDVWDVNKIEAIEEYFSSNRWALAVFTNAYVVDENSKCIDKTLWDSIGYKYKVSDFENKKIINTMLKKDIVTGATLAFRSSMIEYIIPIDMRYIHDTWIAMLAASQGRLGAIPDKLMKYRVYQNQSLGIKKQTLFNNLTSVYASDKKTFLKNIDKHNSVLNRLHMYNLESDSGTSEIIQKINFLRNRVDYSNNFFKRLLQIIFVINKGGYFKYSYNGFYSILKDIIGLKSKKM